MNAHMQVLMMRRQVVFFHPDEHNVSLQSQSQELTFSQVSVNKLRRTAGPHVIMSAANMIATLTRIQDFLTTHAAAASREDIEVVQNAQFASLKRQLLATGMLDVGIARNMLAAVDGGPWEMERKTELR